VCLEIPIFIAIPNPINGLFIIVPKIMLSALVSPVILSTIDNPFPTKDNPAFVTPAQVADSKLTSPNDLPSNIICEAISPPVPTANVPSNIKGTLATSVINPVNPPTTAPIRIPDPTSCPLAAAEIPPYTPPKTAPIPNAISKALIAKLPEGSYLLIGLLNIK
jgi:hypothetical protein